MVESRPRRTKIVGTIGPASNSIETLEALIRAGLDVARLNFSHGSHDDHRLVYESVREAERRAGKPVAVMQDLQGPKIRLGKLKGEVVLTPGESIILSSDHNFVGEKPLLPTTYDRLAKDVGVGERVLLADGRLAVEVTKIEGPDVHTKVVVGGTLTSNKGINLPGSILSVPALTDKDLQDLAFGLSLGIDYVALSFVRTAQDIEQIKEEMASLGRVVPVIAKIEKPQAVDNLVEIIDAAEGIMVARGDLGVELPPEKVPGVQRRAIRLARERGKLTVVATQMLMSMTKNARPTHAEVSDVANAVFDGTDAVMLSEETAAGAHPIKAVETMAALAKTAEEAPDAFLRIPFADSVKRGHAGAIAAAAVVTAAEVGAQAIVSYTRRGLGPRLIGTWRPHCLILGCASTDQEVRRMAFYWGVQPIKIPPPESVEGLVTLVENATVDQGILGTGATMVITSKMPFTEPQETNMLKLHTIERRRGS